MIFAPTFASRFLSGVSHIWRPYREQQVTRRTVVNRGAAQVGKSLRLQKMNSVDRMIKEPAPVQDAENYIRLSPSPRAVCRRYEVKKEEMVNCILGRVWGNTGGTFAYDRVSRRSSRSRGYRFCTYEQR